MAAHASTPTRTGPPGSSVAGVRRRVAAIHFPHASERVRPQLRFVGLELLLWGSLYGLYLAVRGLSIAGPDEAVANARSVVEFERETGLFHEASLQDLLGAVEEALSLYYLLGFAPLLGVVLASLAVRNRSVYGDLRTLLLISIGLAAVVHIVLPVAPPRLVPELGIADTVGLDRDGASFAGIPYNPYAAMPSMHVGWSLLVALCVFQATSLLPVRAVFAAHPAVMSVAVTATGNHYFLDSVAGVLVALTALGLWRLVAPSRSRLPARPQPACASC